MFRSCRIIITFIIIIGFSQSMTLLSQVKNVGPIFLDLIQLEKYHDEFINKDPGSKIIKEKIILPADDLLGMKPLSVMDKSMVPLSGDKHDFTSMGPYWWPDPTKPNGSPYIRRDGERNPEYYKITDESYLTKTIESVENLAIAFYITKDSKYAEKAGELLRVWFLNNKTKMNPNMKHSQFIPGINTGRGIGLIESRYIFKITDSIILLRSSSTWKKDEDMKLTKWFEDYFKWITTHKYGLDESNEKNNHGTWYDVQSTAIAIFLGKDDYAKKVLQEAKQKRIDVQIETDGKQPLELARTKSWGYSLMNLSAFMHLAVLGDYMGIDLWHYQTSSGGSIKKALDFLLPYAINKDKWEYKQIEKMSNESLVPLLRMAQKKYDDRLYKNWLETIFGKNLKLREMGKLL
jgi:hypothetical protein